MDRISRLEKKIDECEKRISKLEKEKTPRLTNITDLSRLEKLLIEKIFNIKPQDLIVLILYSNSKQTKEQIKNKFLSLGTSKKMLNWFKGGNFKQRLIDTGLVFEDSKNEDVSAYSLTEGKGKQKAVSIIEKLEGRISKK